MSMSPYPGLRPFRRDESDLFFGREEQVDLLLKKLGISRFLSVTGPSGCGKSSLVRAGMIAALETGFMVSAGVRWHVVEMRPGAHPLRNMAEALLDKSMVETERAMGGDDVGFLLATLKRGPLGLVEFLRESRFPENTNLLLLVDQFEEIFRYRDKEDSEEAEAFVSLLIASVQQSELPIYAVITMRSDFLGDCALFEGLPELINESQFLTPRLSRDQCRKAIVLPAKVFGNNIEPKLVNRLLNDMGSNPDQLPLMQHVLMRMWTKTTRESKASDTDPQDDACLVAPNGNSAPINLTLSCYKEVGGLSKSLSNHADEAFKKDLDSEQQYIAEVLFRCLSERGPDMRDIRRPAQLKEVRNLVDLSVEKVEAVVDVFRRPDCSFITPSIDKSLKLETFLDISHESLIRQWSRLNKWVEQEARSAEIYRRLEQTASLWEKDEAALWGKPDLDIALSWKEREKPSYEWSKRYGDNFKQAMEFLDASEKKREDEEKEADAARESELRKKGLLLTGALIALVFTVIIAAWAFSERNKAQQEQIRAQREQIRAQRLSSLSAAQNIISHIEERQKQGKRDELTALLTLKAYLLVYENKGLFSMRKVDACLRSLLKSPYFSNLLGVHGKPVNFVAYSPDGNILASASDDNTIRLWDPRNPGADPVELKGHKGWVRSVAFSPDGDLLASASDEGTIYLWNPRDPTVPLIEWEGHAGSVHSVAFSPVGGVFASAGNDNTIHLWDLERGRGKPELLESLKGHKKPVYSVAFSADGNLLASASGDKTVRIWNLRDRSTKPIIFNDHQKGVNSVAFNQDGNFLASASNDNTVRLWDLRHDNPDPVEFEEHEDSVNSVAFSPDGDFIASASDDKTIRLWDLRDPTARPIVLKDHEHPVNSVAFSPVGGVFASAGFDKKIRLWERRDQSTEPVVLKDHDGPVNSVAFSPVGGVFASAGFDKKIRLWDLEDLSAGPKDLTGHEGIVFCVAYNRDGTILASGSEDKTVRLWNPNELDSPPIATLKDQERQGQVLEIAFSPDGSMLASCGSEHDILIWNVKNRSSKPIRVLEGHTDWVNSVAFSPDGNFLASASDDTMVHLWDLRHDNPDPVKFEGHKGSVNSVTFSPDGKILASASRDTTIRLWDPSNPDDGPKKVLWVHKGEVHSLAFSSTGLTLASASKDGKVIIWNLKDYPSKVPNIAELRDHAYNEVHSVAFSPDGNLLASASADGTSIIQWIRTEFLAQKVCKRVKRNLPRLEWQQYVGVDIPYEILCPGLPILSTTEEKKQMR